MKKKIVVILLSAFSIFIVALLVLPIIFKDEIKDEILRYANKNIDGEIQIEDYDLSLLSDFPELSFNFEGLKVLDANKKTSVNIENVFASINSKDFILDRSISVLSIVIDKPVVEFHLQRDTLSPVDLKKGDEIINTSESLDESNKSSISFNINSYEIVNGNIKIYDEFGDETLSISNFNHSGFGVYQGQVLQLKTSTFIENIEAKYNKNVVLADTKLEGEVDLKLDFDNNIYTLEDNSLQINKIGVSWVGVIKKVKDTFDIDLRFDTPNTTFKDLLANIPDRFKRDIDKVETGGNFKIEGFIKGVYGENMLPGFKISTVVDNAFLQYPDLPEKVSDINFKMVLEKPNVYDIGKTELYIPNVKAKISDNLVKGSVKVINPFIDPFVDANIHANINLAKVKNAIPFEEKESLNGTIKADISLNGKVSDLSDENYDKFEASGELSLKDLTYVSNSFNDKVIVKNADVSVNSRYLELKNLNFRLGRSDISATGKVSKYIEYIMKGESLDGNLSIKSKKIYLSDFVKENEQVAVKQEKAEEGKVTGSDGEMGVIIIPERINIDNNISIGEFHSGSVLAKNVKGHLGLKDQSTYMSKMSMDIFGGKTLLDGNYSSKDSLSPKVNFAINLKKISIQDLERSIKFVKEVAPVIKATRGRISAKIDLKTDLNSKMSPVYNTMYSKGVLNTHNLSLSNTDFLKDLGKVLNVEELTHNPKVADVNISYGIEKGIMNIKPFNLKLADIESTIGGNTNIGNKTLDLDVSMIFPRKYLNKDANNIINSAVGIANTFGAKLSIGDNIDVNAKITGDIMSPDYSLTYGPDKSKTPEEYLKKEADRLIEEAKKGAGKDLEKKAKNFLNNLFK